MMELLFLGTGAADYSAADRGKPGFRRRSSAMLDGALLIDPGPDIFDYAESSGNSALFSSITDVIITHSHDDHLSIESLARLGRLTHPRVHGDPAVIAWLRGKLGADADGLALQELPLFCESEIGNYRITALPANHMTPLAGENPRLYLIESEGKRIFWGTDSAWWPTATWRAIRDLRLDLAVLELTCGELAPDDWRSFEHTTIDMLTLMLRVLRRYGRAEGTRIYTTHHAKTLHTAHPELVARLAPLGVTPAYDGLAITI